MNIQSESEAVQILDDGHRDPLEREAAGRYLQHHPSQEIIPRLVTALRDDDVGVRRAAAEALIRLGIEAWPDLLLALTDAKCAGDARLCQGAYLVLHRPFAVEETVPLLRQLQGVPTTDISVMIEADRLYRRMLSNESFAARVAAIHKARPKTATKAKENKPMDIPLDADVQCEAQAVGHSRMVIVDPIRRLVTHFVLEEKDYPYVERLVPLDLVQKSTPVLIELGCTCQELMQQKTFVDAEYLHPCLPYLAYMTGEYALWPYFPTPELASVSPEHFHLQPGEQAVSCGTCVRALDGQVGRVDEFLVNPQTGQITHLLLREGHLWSQKDVAIPVAQIDHLANDTVFLKLDKRDIKGLPVIAVPR